MAFGMGREEIFFKILVFLAVITAITAILNLTNSGAVRLGDLGSGDYMQHLPGQLEQNINFVPGTINSGTPYSGQMFTGQDFTTDTGYNKNLTFTSYSTGASDWDRTDGIGYISNPPNFNFIGWGYGHSDIGVLGALSKNNVFDNTYNIYNPFQDQPVYFVIAAYSRSLDLSASMHLYGNFVVLTENGIATVDSADTNHYLDFIEYPYANSAQEVEIVYDNGGGNVEVILDGIDAGTLDAGTKSVPVNNNAGSYIANFVYLAGVTATSPGLQVKDIQGQFFFIDSGAGGDTAGGIQAALTFLGQIWGAVVQFAGLIGAALGLNSNSLVPFWVWAIIGLPCLATLVLIGFEMMRGN